MRYACETRAVTCKRTFEVVARYKFHDGEYNHESRAFAALSKLTVIQASNHISQTAVHNSSKSYTKPPYRQKQNQPFLGKGHFQSRWKPQKNWTKKEETGNKINIADDIMSKLHKLQ